MGRVVLRDGRLAVCRVPHGPGDRRGLAELFRRVSPESLYFRFFHTVRDIEPDMLDAMLQVDGENRFTWICVTGGHVVGVGSYARADEATAEVALLVDDSLHGCGVGTLLLEQLADTARRHGFHRLVARVLWENRRMIELLAHSGYRRSTCQRETPEVVFELSLQGPAWTRSRRESGNGCRQCGNHRPDAGSRLRGHGL
ncbi:MAG: GNAT family N-acetyltransferase [Alicyclobacillaceae bacterium]|nr:GNAT family N-acetyltransferase [Alicyclobacillaceae bacterium]